MRIEALQGINFKKMTQFQKGNQLGRRNHTELRYKLYRKQKNLFTTINNRINRRGIRLRQRKKKYTERLIKILIANMDRDYWVRDVVRLMKYYKKQSGDSFNYSACEGHWYQLIKILKDLGYIKQKKRLENLKKLYRMHKTSNAI